MVVAKRTEARTDPYGLSYDERYLLALAIKNLGEALTCDSVDRNPWGNIRAAKDDLKFLLKSEPKHGEWGEVIE
jgi:hypothetical protein